MFIGVISKYYIGFYIQIRSKDIVSEFSPNLTLGKVKRFQGSQNLEDQTLRAK